MHDLKLLGGKRKTLQTQDTGREEDFLGRTDIAQEIIPREKEPCEIKIFFLHSQGNNQQRQEMLTEGEESLLAVQTTRE